jgi:hypothetical protein
VVIASSWALSGKDRVQQAFRRTGLDFLVDASFREWAALPVDPTHNRLLMDQSFITTYLQRRRVSIVDDLDSGGPLSGSVWDQNGHVVMVPRHKGVEMADLPRLRAAMRPWDTWWKG